MFRAGFAEVDVSPIAFPVRTYLGEQDSIDDPIHAHAAVFSDGAETVAVVSVDVVILEWEYVSRIREQVSTQCDIAGNRVLVCATHNHACPAVVERPGHGKEHGYLDHLVDRTAQAVAQAVDDLAPAEMAVATGLESRVSHNRRFIKRDGTVITQPSITDVGQDILCNEGVIDPEVGVVCLRSPEGEVRAVLVNFACHACHGMGRVSAGYPGVMARRIKERFGTACGVLFLNGACANLIHHNFLDQTEDTGADRTGGILGDDVIALVEAMEDFDPDPVVRMAETTQPVRFRDWTVLEKAVANPSQFVNVFEFLINLGWYSYSLQYLRELRAQADHLPATQQALRLGQAVFATVPAEYFTENGLRIKELSDVPRTFVVSLANGWLGYIPHPEAFGRQGGHETFPALWSKMEVDAGRILGDRALGLIREVSQ